MNWINKRKLPAIKNIKYEGQLCLILESLWGALHATFNTACYSTKVWTDFRVRVSGQG